MLKITMDTYRYSIFREKMTERGISVESKDNPDGILCLIRKIPAACGILAPVITKLFEEHRIDFGNSAIMRWYTNNTALEQNKFGNYMFTKVEPVRRKNDGFMAFVAAEFRAQLLEEKVIYV